MARYFRYCPPGSLQHLISRIVARDRLFDLPQARSEYLRRVEVVAKRTDWRFLGYAVMGSHVHWAAIAGEHPSATFVKPLHVGFATWLNRRRDRIGPVFADRYRSITFPSQKLPLLLAYIHNNPVRAGVVADPRDSAWTSHRAYLGLDPAPSWLDVARGLELCGFEGAAARVDFDELVLAHAHGTRSKEFSGAGLAELRSATRRRAANPVELAGPRLTPEAASLAALPVIPRACPLRVRFEGSPSEVLLAVAARTGIAVDVLRGRSRTRDVTSARRLSLWTWARVSRPLLEMAQTLGIGSSAACGLVARASAEEQRSADSLVSELLAANAKHELTRTVPRL